MREAEQSKSRASRDARGNKNRTSGEENGGEGRSRSEEKLAKLLGAAAELIARQGFGQTTIRDVARETGFSLAGMYYYFENKEDLLYQIQHRTFASLLTEQERAIAEKGSPAEKLERLVRNHLTYFTRHTSEMKICAFEMTTLQNERYQNIESLRRRYYRCVAEVIALMLGVPADKIETNRKVRHHTLFVFGMLNWIFMWYDPERDVTPDELGDEMLTLLVEGLPSA